MREDEIKQSQLLKDKDFSYEYINEK